MWALAEDRVEEKTGINAGNAVFRVSVESHEVSACIMTAKQRVPFLLSGILDAISFTLFYLSFSALAYLVSAMWHQLSAEK
jgi:hypothetical protein